MEYTIYNESLVYYALRNKETGGYVCNEPTLTADGYKYFCDIDYSKDLSKIVPSGIKKVYMFNDLKIAQSWAKDTNYEIRKVKVIDIGEVPEEI